MLTQGCVHLSTTWEWICVVITHTGAAVIDVSLAVDPTVSRLTLASVAAHCVPTMTSILTWVFLALVYILCALDSYTHISDRDSWNVLDRFSWIKSTTGNVMWSVIKEKVLYVVVSTSNILLRNENTPTHKLKALTFPSAVAQAGVAGVIQGWLTNPSSLTGLRITGD